MGVSLIWPYKYKDIDSRRQEKLPDSQSLLCEHPIHFIVITKIFSLLTTIKMSSLVFWGCPSWAMVCWMNTRSVCRICQINFKSERIWAVNTQEIALLAWPWSVIQEDEQQRRQEKEKACQGNWIICGIILSDIQFLFLFLNILRHSWSVVFVIQRLRSQWNMDEKL